MVLALTGLQVALLGGLPWGLQDEDVLALAAAVPNLRVLDISGHADLGDAALVALGACQQLSKVRHQACWVCAAAQTTSLCWL
jgi:hypothetical protein